MTQSSSGHLPRTDAQGRFQGEGVEARLTLWQAADQDALVVLDSGLPRQITGPPAVNHDAGRVDTLRTVVTPAPELAPSALPFEHTPERRAQRSPAGYWTFMAGRETNVQARAGGVNTTTWQDAQLHFDGVAAVEVLHTGTQTVTAYDFDWQFRFEPGRGSYAGTAPLDLVASADGAGAYRTQELTRYELNGLLFAETVIQGHVTNVWLSGDLSVGQGEYRHQRYTEITAVHEADAGPPARTRVNAWLPIATLTGYVGSGDPPDASYGTPEYEKNESTGAWELRRYLSRSTVGTHLILRDILTGPEPTAPEPPPIRFTAAGGQVRVTGSRTYRQALLHDQEGVPNATLNAFGHKFVGGTWAALRDRPKRREDGTWDYSPLIVLHASDTTVTAIRPDGSTEICTPAQFVTDVLRLPLPDDPEAALPFLGFSSVGSLSHSWPPEWAWAICAEDTRALCAHEPWRDSYKKAAPDSSPLDWTWPTRPGRKPRVIPEAAPRGLLGLTLADVAGEVRHDELLAKGQGPVEPPISATSGGVDVLKRVAKRLPYSPAEIPDERDDRTGVNGQVTVTFAPLPEPTPGPGETVTRFAALYLVTKLPAGADTLTVNGVALPLEKLGHNRAEKRGYHPYAAAVPFADTYTLALKGKTTLIGRCARAYLVTGGQNE